jgi:uncharacterized protein YceK
MKRILYALAILALATMVGCSSSQATTTVEPGVYYTQAAQTIAVELTRAAPTQAPPPLLASPTLMTIPTSTATPPPPISGASQTPNLCNQAMFVYDVTIPDGTIMSPNQSFTKTWLLKNIGTCTWNSGYHLVYISGNPMGGSTSPLLITGTFPPGQSVEASVSLKAPALARTYEGYWKLSDPNGNLFGLQDAPFWVRIKVVTTGTVKISLNAVSFESGSVAANGSVLGGINVGDTVDKDGVQGFLSFDISSIPKNAVIDTGALDLTQFETIGDPFGALGCLNVYQQIYTPLSAGDFFTGGPSGSFMEWCSAADLSNVTVDSDFASAIQARLGTSIRIQFRLQFPDRKSNGNGTSDQVQFGIPYLIVQYTIP